jgi:Flp pilus assembly protein TadG
MIRRRGSLNRKGQALVEFALVLPLVLLLVVGMLEFARIWNLHQVMTDAVREGARRALLADDLTGTEAQDSVKAPMWRYLAQFGYNPSYATMTIAPLADFKESGANITIELSLPYRIWVLGNRSLTMKSSVTVRNE